MQKLLLVILITFCSSLYGQQFQWIKKIDGVYNQLPTGNRLATGKSGSSYVVSTFSGQSVAGSFTLTSGSTQATSVLKYDGNGNVIWAKKITGSIMVMGNAISIDKLNNVYVTGYFNNDATFETTTLTSTSPSATKLDLFVAKYDSIGVLIWAKNFSGDGGARAHSIISDSLSNSYITGVITNTVVFGTNTVIASPNQDMLLLKLDGLGNVQWAKKFGGNTQINAYDITIDNNLNIYTTGHFGVPGGGLGANLVIGTTTLTSNIKTPDIFLAKFDNSGNPVFANKLGGNFEGDRGYGITFDKRNHLYLTGGFEGSAIFGSYTVNATPPVATKYDCFIAKYDLNGTCKWAKKPDTLLTYQGWAVHAADPNSIYIGGEVLNTVIFKFDSTGTQKWKYKIKGGCGGCGFGISSDKNGAIYVQSSFTGTLSTNAGTLTTPTNTVTNNFVGKIDTALVTNVNLIENSYLEIKIFPNPVIASLNIMQENTLNENSLIEIINISGQCVLKTKYKDKIDVSFLPSGLYTILIKGEGSGYTYKKFIKT